MQSDPAAQELDVGLADKDIQTLVQEIERGKIALPEFQRDFVWPTGQVGKLLESLLNGYYINTLLTLPVMAGEENVPFPPRSVEVTGEDPTTSGQMEMVLDGQQRITSIHYALTAPEIPLDNTKYPQLFGLKFSKVVDGVLDEEAIEWNSTYHGVWGDLEVDDYETHIEKDFVPFTVFKDSDTFDDWRWGMEDYAEDSGSISLKDVRQFDRNTKVFRGYDVPIIKMSADTQPSTVVQTFERINTQGLELGVFDILTARLYPDGILLRELWEEARDRYQQVDSYVDVAGVERVRKRILKTLALHRGEKCKDSELQELSSAGYEHDWSEACEMLNRALEKARSRGEGGLGVIHKYGFPYATMLPTLANLIHISERELSCPNPERLAMTRRWYWSSVFSLRYSGSSDTTSYQDYNEVRDWIREGRNELPEAIKGAPQRIPVELDLETLTQGGPYKGIMSLLVLNDARDFGTFESIRLYEIDDHHIFPNSVLKSGIDQYTASDSTKRNRILNRTVIESDANRFGIRDKPPSKYVREMIKRHQRDEEGIKDVLEDHFINETAFEAMLEDDYATFCEERKETIRAEIEERIGESIDWSVGEETA